MQIYNGYMCEDDYRKLEGNLGGTLAKISESMKSQIDNIIKESVGA